jgi:hypothetical protein
MIVADWLDHDFLHCTASSKKPPGSLYGPTRGGLTTKAHRRTRPAVELVPTPGQAGNCPVTAQLLGHLRPGTIVLADKDLRCRLAVPPDRSRRGRTQHSADGAPPLEAVLQPGALPREKLH